MWAIFAIFILVGGYIYVDAHLPSKYKLRKSVGWNAYFLVAVKGAEFVLIGGALALIVITIIYGATFLINLPAYAIKSTSDIAPDIKYTYLFISIIFQ